MMRPSSQASKILLLLLFLMFIYFITMDTSLFFRVQKYRLDIFEVRHDNASSESTTSQSIQKLPSYESVTWVPCSFNPLCHPTVKALMVDPVNHYIYAPLCTLLDLGLGISETMLFMTPNMISFSHVVLAAISGKLFTSQSLTVRRIGVVFFQLKMFLDDLDGHVARERMHQKGERSEVGTLGYWVDGIADTIGGTFMVLGIAFYLLGNPPRKGYKGNNVSALPYHKLNQINTQDDIEKDNTAEVGISYKTKVSHQRIVKVVLLFSGQLVLSSLAWNKYIELYQNLLENPTGFDVKRREETFRSSMFFHTSGIWRLVNPHSLFHLLCVAVFCDKTWGFLKAVHLTGYMCLVFSVATTGLRLNADTVYVAKGLVKL